MAGRVRKLVDYSLGLYASQDYLDHTGAPHTLDALKGRSLIESATAIGQFEAVRAGAGIRICHDFMATGEPDLVRLLPAMSVTRSYWMVRHENLRVARRVHAVADLLDEMVRKADHAFAPG